MIVAEVESIGGFVGGSVSEPLLQGGILCSVLAYMIHVDLWMAGTAFAAVRSPARLRSADARRDEPAYPRARPDHPAAQRQRRRGAEARRARATGSTTERIQQVFELNMGIFRLKFSMNFLMNLSTQLQIIGGLLGRRMGGL